ncbi:DNA methyltransferase, partial [Salmonella enterica]|uniref:DNA methyltransferase n=1 Tax=Salmonella enterica TaxID=28901 RepID=UPI003D2B5647
DDVDNQPEIEFQNSGGEIYICGNPPYLGAKKKSPDQVMDMERVGLGDAKLLDYIAPFIIKGLQHMQKSGADMALVSTSSICQGE